MCLLVSFSPFPLTIITNILTHRLRLTGRLFGVLDLPKSYRFQIKNEHLQGTPYPSECGRSSLQKIIYRRFQQCCSLLFFLPPYNGTLTEPDLTEIVIHVTTY